MKKHITGLLLCLLTLVLAGCLIEGDREKPDPQPGDTETQICFVNANDFSVSVYSDRARIAKIADVGAKSQSDSKETEPNTNGAVFYPTYHIMLYGVSIPYEGEAFVDRIDPKKTTLVPIPLLRELGAAELAKPLNSNAAYLRIQNDSSSSLSLRRGSSEMQLEGEISTILRGGETGLYIISPGPSSDYSFRRNTTYPVDFPEGLTEFVVGWFYSLRFDGSELILVVDIPLTLSEALGIYSVIFETGGGSDVPFQTVNKDERATRPEDPSRTGYTFAGWYSDLNFNTVYNFNTPVTGSITLYAKWNAITYTVAYNANGGNGNMTATGFTYDAVQNLRANVFTRANYIFQGWATSATGTVTYTNEQSVSNMATTAGDTVTLYAVWAHTYAVAYNSNGGSGTMDYTSFTYGVAQNLRTNTLTRANYVFMGWATSSSGAVVYKDEQNVNNLTTTPGGTVTLYAVWAHTYAVAYNANSGNGTMANTDFTYGVPQNLRANSFTRSGYAFAGWATSEAGAAVYMDGQSVNNLTATAGETVTLYAVWSVNFYTVVYNANGGSGNMENSDIPIGVSQILQTNVFTRTGYTFGGWARTETGTAQYTNGQSVNNLSTTANVTVTLYAVWIPNTYTVTFNKNTTDAGSAEASPQTRTVTVPATNISALPTAPSRPHWTFNGWNTQANGGGTAFTVSTTVNANVTVYAQWTPNTYTITFNKNNNDIGSTDANPLTRTVTTPATTVASLPTSPSRTGYIFIGWNIEANGSGTAFTVSAPVLESITVYAQWSPVPYTVAYNANGGSGTMANTGFTYGTAQNLRTNSFTRSGYNFGGWATSATGTVTYTNGQSVSNLATTAGATVTLYAVWYSTVTFNANGATSGMSSPALEANAGNSITLPGVGSLARTGYTFGGWNINTAGTGTNYNGGASYTPDGNITLYAKWNINQYAVTFNADGGTPAPAQQTINHGSKIPQPAAMTKTGFGFSGWYKEAALNNLWNFNTDTVTENISLHARWVRSVASVTGVPATATAGTPLTLTGTVAPTNADYQTIVWSVQSAGTTGASISGGNILNTTGAGSAVVTATIANGIAIGTAYTQNFTITVQMSQILTITFAQITDAAPSITGPTISRTGTGWSKTATISVSNPSQYSTIEWYVTGGINTSGASITLDASYYLAGEHFLTVEVVKDGKPYNRTVSFTVVP